MMCFIVSWLLLLNEESSMVMFLWKLGNWLFMLLQWKVTVYDKHTIPSCQETPDSLNPYTLVLATICRAIHCTAHHCTHISVMWLWKSGILPVGSKHSKITRIWLDYVFCQ